jgi:hypothetical protein
LVATDIRALRPPEYVYIGILWKNRVRKFLLLRPPSQTDLEKKVFEHGDNRTYEVSSASEIQN